MVGYKILLCRHHVGSQTSEVGRMCRHTDVTLAIISSGNGLRKILTLRRHPNEHSDKGTHLPVSEVWWLQLELQCGQVELTARELALPVHNAGSAEIRAHQTIQPPPPKHKGIGGSIPSLWFRDYW